MSARRDEVAQIIGAARAAFFGGRTDGLTVLDEDLVVADALLAAGLIVPEGMTAEKLRAAAEPAHPYHKEMRAELRAWADVLGAVGGSLNAGEAE